MKEALTEAQNKMVNDVLDAVYSCDNDRMAIGVVTSTLLVTIAGLHNKLDIMNANLDLIGEELGFNTKPSQEEADETVGK